MPFMVNWLKNFTGQEKQTLNGERAELEALRKEVEKYIKADIKDDEEAKIKSQSGVRFIPLKFLERRK